MVFPPWPRMRTGLRTGGGDGGGGGEEVASGGDE